MYCENCGKKIPDDSQFCPECGAPVHHEDESLISRARRNDNEAIQQVMDQYKGMVRYQARMYVKNEDDVNEIEQQVYIKAFSKTSDLTDEKKFGGWLKTIAINTAKDYVTSAFKKRSVMFTDLDDTNNDMVYDAADERIDHVPEAQMDETSRRDIILKVLDSLPETQRTVIVMHYYDNLSFRDIAEQLDIPMSTVTGRVQQAKNSIKASVTEIQNREGIKLYNLSPIAFFLWLLGLERKAPVTVTPPVIGKTVKVTNTEPAKKDKSDYGNHGDKVNKTVKTKAAKTTAKATGKAAAGKAAGTGFVATTAGKIVIAGAVAVAVGTGAIAGKHYRDTQTGQAKIQESGQKNSKSDKGSEKQAGEKKITSDLVSQSVKKGNQSGIVWVKEPGSMDIDDFEDLQSARTDGTIMGRYSTVEENNGYSPNWIVNDKYLVTSYPGNGIIVKKDKLLGIGDYDGKVITKPSYESIEAENAIGIYRVMKPGESTDTSDTYYLDSDYSVKNAGSGYGDGDWPTYKMFISGNTVYGIDQDGIMDNLVEDASQYDMKAPTIMPSFNGYQSGDVNLNSPDGFKLLQSGSDPVDLPKDMTPVYYASALKYNIRFNELMNSYDYNTCFVNDVIKLQDQKKQIHLWNVKTKKFITDQSFDDATFYEDGYIGVKKDNKWAFMDMSGNIVTDYLFSKVSGLYEGKVYVNYQGKPGILDLKKSVENLGITGKEDQKKSSGQKQSSGKQSQSTDFSKVAGDYVFSSGAGGWGTELKVNADGTFTGVYSDSDMGDTGPGYPKGLMKYAKYSGKFKDLKKLEDNKYQVTLDGNLKYANKPGASEIKDQTLYNYTEAYGFEDTDTFTVILPGYDQSKLDQQIQSWIYPVAGTESSQSSVTKQNLIINDADLDTFVQMKQ